MQLGTFSVSLAVKDIQASKSFYEKLGFTKFGGDETQGWDATLERYRKKYQAKDAEMGKLTFSDVKVTMLGDGYACVRGKFQLERKKDKPAGRFTLIMQKFDDGWKIIHDHTSS